MKKSTFSAAAVVTILTLAGCASPQQILQGMEGTAINSALARGQFLLRSLAGPVYRGDPQVTFDVDADGQDLPEHLPQGVEVIVRSPAVKMQVLLAEEGLGIHDLEDLFCFP